MKPLTRKRRGTSLSATGKKTRRFLVTRERGIARASTRTIVVAITGVTIGAARIGAAVARIDVGISVAVVRIATVRVDRVVPHRRTRNQRNQTTIIGMNAKIAILVSANR
jgi:hypothetical protein